MGGGRPRGQGRDRLAAMVWSWFAVVAIVIVAAVAVTVWFAWAAHRDLERADELAVQRAAAAVAASINRAAAATAGASATLADGSTVAPDLFASYAAEVVAASPIVALATIDVVPGTDRTDWEQRNTRPMLDLAAGGFVPAADRAVHWVVANVQPPIPESRGIIGFDLTSEPNRAATLRQARDTGAVAASAPVLSQPSNRPAVFLARPLYAGRSIPGDVAARRSTLVGFVSTSVNGDAISTDAQPAIGDDTRLRVTDGDALLLATATPPRAGAPTQTIAVAGRTWTVTADSGTRVDWIPTIAAAVGGLALVVAAVALTRQRARRSADRAHITKLEHRVVTDLQAVLLAAPPTPPGFDIAVVYEPADDGLLIGGDWYDAFTGPAGHLSVVAGDVTGHGVDAITSMIELRSTMRALLTTGLSPCDALAAADPGTHLASVIVLDLDPDDGTVTYCNAGHPPPLLLVDGAVIRLDEAHRPLLGLTPRGPVPGGRTHLPAGATLLVYTDGLVERRDLDIDTAINDLAAVLTATDPHLTADVLCASIVAHQRRTVPARDDRLVLAIQRHPTPPDTPGNRLAQTNAAC